MGFCGLHQRPAYTSRSRQPGNNQVHDFCVLQQAIGGLLTGCPGKNTHIANHLTRKLRNQEPTFTLAASADQRLEVGVCNVSATRQAFIRSPPVILQLDEQPPNCSVIPSAFSYANLDTERVSMGHGPRRNVRRSGDCQERGARRDIMWMAAGDNAQSQERKPTGQQPA